MKVPRLYLILAGVLALTPPLAIAVENTTTTDILRQMAERPLTQARMDSNIGTVATMRAEYFPDLALIPADAEAFLTIPNVQGSINRLSSFAPVPFILHELQEEGIPISAPPFKSLTIAAGPGTYAAISHTTTLLEAALAQMLQIIPEVASPDTKLPALARIASLSKTTTLDILTQPLPPITCIAELTPEALVTVQNKIRQIRTLTAGTDNAQSWHEGRYAGLAWEGTILRADRISHNLKQMVRGASPEERLALLNLIARLNNRTLYLLTSVKNGKLLIVLCENPKKDIRLAATPAQSVLATQKPDIADSRLTPTTPPDLLFYIGSPANKTVAASCGLSGIVWGDRGAHLELAERSDTKTTILDFDTPLKLASMANHPETILYAEGASTPATTASLNSLIEAAASYGTRFLDKAPGLPDQQEFIRSIGQMLTSFGDRTAVLVDNRGLLQDKLPADIDASRKLPDYPIPQFVLYKNIDNRQTLAAAWEKTFAIGRIWMQTPLPNTFEKTSLDTTKENGLTTYTLNPGSEPDDNRSPLGHLMVTTEHFMLSSIAVCLTDRSWAFGTSPEYAKEIVRTAETASSPLKGAAFALRMQPIKELANRNWATLRAMGKDTMKAQGAFNLIFAQIDGLYATVTRQTDTTYTHICVKTK